MYRGFAGHDPSIQPYIDYYGLGGGDGAAPASAAAPAAVPAEAPKKGERGR
jgi:peptidyl-dipeptidase Dcp